MEQKEKSPKLPPRLLTAAAMVPAGQRIADIGTDHAYLPIYLVQKGIAPFAVASDVRLGPLTRARANVEKYGLAPKISLLLCDGIDDGKMGDCSVFIVAGMGGELIGEILRKSAIAKKEGVTLILQPMTGEEELRLFLAEAGFAVTDERLTKEGDRLYLTLMATFRGGRKDEDDEAFYYAGRELFRRKDPLLQLYIAKKTAALQKAERGLLRSHDPEREKKIQQLRRLAARLKELGGELL